MSVVESPHVPAPTGGYADLAAEVRRLGLLRPRPGFYAALLAVSLFALAATVTGLLALRESWWAILLAPVLAVVSTQIAFFGHDAGHRQITRRRGVSQVLGLVSGNLLNGLSYTWWIAKHNAHHAHPNDLTSDPDVYPGALVFDADHALGRRRLASWLTRHQAWLFFPLLTLEAMNLHVSSARALMRPGARHRGLESALLVMHVAAYLALLLSALSWQQVIVFAVVHQAVFGIYLGCSFAPGHKGMPVLKPDQAEDPLLRQVLTSRNVRGGMFVDYALGGLNYQIEHHLFPSMPRPNLRHAQVVVRRFCETRSVRYEEVTARASYASAVRHLHAVGAELRNARRRCRH
ncbi:MAG TPA: acyl-CoA desaturase [Nocardioidaceae bacterium]|nr:acyl-CoA desaturase [Nocardioidaceae bacterium]